MRPGSFLGRMGSRLKPALLLAGALGAAGCLPVGSARSLVGVYQLDLPDSKTTLTISGDQTFREVYVPRTGASVVCKGRWTWSSDDHHISLEGAFVPRPPDSMHSETIDCSDGLDTIALRDFSGVYLETDPDGEANFRKTP